MSRAAAGRRAVGGFALAVIATTCSSAPRKAPTIDVPGRGDTGGDALLATLPAGADSILELDLARLRANPTVGELFTVLAESSQAESSPGVNFFGAGDLVVFVSYGIGDTTPERVVVVRGPQTDAIRGAYRIDDQTVAIASGAMQKRIALVAAGEERSLADNSMLLRLRALAMPEGADGAAIRVAAHLDFNARIALAKALELEEVPISLSVWGDVADDLAIVALVSGESASEGRRLISSLEQIRARLSILAAVRRLALSRVVRGATIESQGAAARMVLLIGPRRLARLASKLLARLKGDA